MRARACCSSRKPVVACCPTLDRKDCASAAPCSRACRPSTSRCTPRRGGSSAQAERTAVPEFLQLQQIAAHRRGKTRAPAATIAQELLEKLGSSAMVVPVENDQIDE